MELRPVSIALLLVSACGESPASEPARSQERSAPERARPSESEIPAASETPAAPETPPTPEPSPAPDVAPRIEVPHHRIESAALDREFAELDAKLAVYCPELKLRRPDDEERERLSDEEWSFTLEVRSVGHQLLLTWDSQDGTGMYGFEVSSRHEIYDLRRCSRRELGSVWKGRLVTDQWAHSAVSNYPADDGLAALFGEWADCSDPRHGFACMFLSVHQRCDENSEAGRARPKRGRDWDLVPITQNPSPWVAGERAEQVSTYWPVKQFWGRLKLPIPDLSDDESALSGFNHVGRSVMPPSAAQLVRKVGRYRLYAAFLPIKNGGYALLMRDDMQPRHRWIGHTRECLLADEVEWLTAGEHLVVGWAEHSGAGPLPDGINGLFVVDLRSGVIHRLRVAELAERWDGMGTFWWRETADEDDEDAVDEWFHVEDRTLVFDGGVRISIADLRRYLDEN